MLSYSVVVENREAALKEKVKRSPDLFLEGGGS